MPFNYDSFMSSPLTGVGLGLLSLRDGDPIGSGITKGLLLSEQIKNSQADRENTAELRKYQQGLLAQQQQQYGLQMLKLQQELDKQAKQDQWAQAMSSGDLKTAISLYPAETAKVLKDTRPETKIQDGQVITEGPNGYQASPIPGYVRPPSQAQPRQLSEMEMWMTSPEIVEKMWKVRASATGGDGTKPPSGYRYKEDSTLEPIPGGPATVKPGGEKVLPATMIESLSDMNQLSKVLVEAENLAQSKNVETGPVSGRWQSGKALIGAADDNFVDVSQKLQTAQNIMLKLRSGAAVTEAEYSRFLKEFPSVNDAPSVRVRKTKNAASYANELLNSKMEAFKEGGYKIPSFPPPPDIKTGQGSTSILQQADAILRGN